MKVTKLPLGEEDPDLAFDRFQFDDAGVNPQMGKDDLRRWLLSHPFDSFGKAKTAVKARRRSYSENCGDGVDE